LQIYDVNNHKKV